jgi:mRNA interferase RelE/StbE
MKRIVWRKKATRQLKKIKPDKTRTKILSAVNQLADFPDCPNVKRLKGQEQYRLRVGNWRIIFTEDLKILHIEEVKKRNERTYH